MSANLASFEPVAAAPVSGDVSKPNHKHYMRSTIGMSVAVFMVVTSFSFVLLYAFKPSFVCVTGSDGQVAEPRTPDAGKCVIASMVVALVVLVLLWVFRK